jgi:hypothetical protein
MVKTWTSAWGQLFQSVFPENDGALLPFWGFPLFSQFFVPKGGTSKGLVKTTWRAIIIDLAKFTRNHSGLHPETGMMFIRWSILKTG